MTESGALENQNVTEVASERAFDWQRTRRFAKLCIVAVVVSVFFSVIYYSLLVPILVSLFLTFLSLPLVELLERRGLPRAFSILLMMAVVGAGITVLSINFAPTIYFQAIELMKLIPQAFKTITTIWIPHVERYIVEWGLVNAGEADRLFEHMNILTRLESQVERGIGGIWRTGISLAGGMFNLGLIPFFMFFLLKDYRSISGALWALVPRDLVAPTASAAHRVNVTLKSVLKGQATVAGVLTVLYVIGLSIVGIQSAVIIGIVAGICRIIPYLDVLVGAILSTIVILSDFQGYGQVIGVIGVFLIVQAVDGAIITPQIIGDRVGLHPMAIIISVIAFGNWFGFWGVLLAVPIVAVAKAFYVAIKPYYLASATYRGPNSPK